MYDYSIYNLNFRAALTRFVHDYARFADLVASLDNAPDIATSNFPKNLATSNFRGFHTRLVRALGLDDDATPDEVIVGVYAFYRAQGGDATMRMMCENHVPAFEWLSHDVAR